MNEQTNSSETLRGSADPAVSPEGVPPEGSSPRAQAPAEERAPEKSEAQAPAEEQAPEKSEAEALLEARQKKRRRRRRAFGSLLLRTALLLAVIYVLFFHLIGLLAMPSNDMYPRLDAGDLVIYYRLDKEPQAQDVIVFEKDATALMEYAAPEEGAEEAASEENSGEESAETAAESLSGNGNEASGDVRSGSAESPTPAPAQPVPRVPDVPPSQIVSDSSFRGQLNRLVYRISTGLGLRRPEGRRVFVCRVIAVQGDTVEITDGGQVLVNGNALTETNIFYPTTVYLGFTEYPLTLGPGECFVLADQRDGGADSRFFGPVKESEILGTVFTIMRRNNL